MDRLCLDELLPLARDGLADLGIGEGEGRYWLGLVEERVRRGLTGAIWQRRYVERHGLDMEALVGAYLERQASDLPVHQWNL
jgi:hypothetical protein